LREGEGGEEVYLKLNDALRIWAGGITKIVFINFIYLSSVFVLDSGYFNYRYKEARFVSVMRALICGSGDAKMHAGFVGCLQSWLKGFNGQELITNHA
jgi:hypothetical protein